MSILDEFYRYLIFEKSKFVQSFKIMRMFQIGLVKTRMPLKKKIGAWANTYCANEKLKWETFDYVSHQQLLFLCFIFRQISIFKSSLKCKDSIKLHKMLQYYNLTDNQVKAECFSPISWAEINFEDRKIGKNGQFLIWIWFWIWFQIYRTIWR